MGRRRDGVDGDGGSDGDGLSDEYERRVGLDPNNRDSDGDTWGDGYEVETAGMNPHVAVLVDSDGDGLSDDAEILEGTDPSQRDSDGDGGFDGYEIEIGSNPRIGGRYIAGPKTRQRLGIGTDSDGDGLSDMTESGFGFSAKNPDTDFDGTSDYDELVLHDTKGAGVDGYFSRPQLPDSSTGSSTLDSDGDGLTDTVEYGLSPTHRADMDDDGLTDREERERGTNPPRCRHRQRRLLRRCGRPPTHRWPGLPRRGRVDADGLRRRRTVRRVRGRRQTRRPQPRLRW